MWSGALGVGVVIGIVVVSHSRALARSGVALAGEMLDGQRVRVDAEDPVRKGRSRSEAAGDAGTAGPVGGSAGMGVTATEAAGCGTDTGVAEAISAKRADVVRGAFVVTNPHGLHARPAARLVAELRGVDAVVELWNASTGAGPVSGRSLSRVAALGVLTGHEVVVVATGSEAG